MRRLHADYVGGEHPNQWKAIYEYARYSNGHQYTPLTFFIVWRPGKGTDKQLDIQEKELAAEALNKGVLISVAKLFF